jgi:hypothetical protein
MKIIESPDRLINAFTASFGEGHRATFERVFSQYTSDAVIAVTAEDIAAQAIEWVNFHQEFKHEAIDNYFDFDRFVFVQNAVLKELDTEAIIDHIQDSWDSNASTTAEAIQEALFAIYKESTIFDLVSNTVVNYKAKAKANV